MANQVSYDLGDFRTSPESRVFSGRPRGEWCRRQMHLDEHDGAGDEVRVVVPAGTYTVNMSFFLGLFGPSVRALGLDGFRARYTFQASDALQSAFRGYEVEALNEDFGIPGQRTA